MVSRPRKIPDSRNTRHAEPPPPHLEGPFGSENELRLRFTDRNLDAGRFALNRESVGWRVSAEIPTLFASRRIYEIYAWNLGICSEMGMIDFEKIRLNRIHKAARS
jgi:hypothetical protein